MALAFDELVEELVELVAEFPCEFPCALLAEFPCPLPWALPLPLCGVGLGFAEFGAPLAGRARAKINAAEIPMEMRRDFMPLLYLRRLSLALVGYLMRRELVTTKRLLSAIAPAAYIGDIKPAAAIGIPITL